MLRETLAGARRSWRGLALWVLACIVGALAYVQFATPQFVATAQVVLEPHQGDSPYNSQMALQGGGGGNTTAMAR